MPSATAASQTPARDHPRLYAEFVVLFIATPLAMAVFVPPGWLFPVLGAVTLIGMALLAVTPGFRWAELLGGAGRMNWTLILGTVLGTLIVGYGIISLTDPDARFTLVRYNLPLMAMIALLYPFLSALPQEIVFRPLFFRRYQPILPRRANPAILLNAAIFSFAHLMYWSLIVAAMTFAGGLVFAYSYRVRGNFPEAVVAHALAGIAIFALGLGVFFYSGNVTRPF